LEQVKNKAMTAVWATAAIVSIAFLAEFAIMAGLSALGRLPQSMWGFVLDALLLAGVIAAPIYWLVLKPLRREYEKRVEAEQRAEDLGQLAITDPLTRIMNRRGITVSVLDAMAQAERYGNPLAVAMADIDHFKQVNDTYGHEVGDKVLADIASVLSESLRMPDKVGRYGGEEFLVVLPHTTLAQARKIAERMRTAVGAWPFELGGKETSLTISIGLTEFQKGEDLEQLLSRVDRALYQAKAGGRNLVVTEKTPARAASRA
jgi:diguanylate cyclase (GGDEF)-like protein